MMRKSVRILSLFTMLIGFAAMASDQDISAAPPTAALNDYETTSVPTSLTEICSAKDCWIGFIVISNPTGGAITLLAQNGAGTPFQMFPATSIGANAVLVANFQPTGMKMTSGFKIQASASGLHLSLHSRRL